jgi:acyl-CoA-binding protein
VQAASEQDKLVWMREIKLCADSVYLKEVCSSASGAGSPSGPDGSFCSASPNSAPLIGTKPRRSLASLSSSESTDTGPSSAEQLPTAPPARSAIARPVLPASSASDTDEADETDYIPSKAAARGTPEPQTRAPAAPIQMAPPPTQPAPQPQPPPPPPPQQQQQQQQPASVAPLCEQHKTPLNIPSSSRRSLGSQEEGLDSNVEWLNTLGQRIVVPVDRVLEELESGELHARFVVGLRFAKPILTSSHAKYQASDEQKLLIYGFFKQSTQGDCGGETPPVSDWVTFSKHKVWASLHGVPKEVAKRQFLQVLNNVAPGWSDRAANPNVVA